MILYITSHNWKFICIVQDASKILVCFSFAAYFTGAQRQATEDAGVITSLDKKGSA